MGRYDLSDSEGLTIDEEGLELRDVQAAQDEAALSLADAAGIASADLTAPFIRWPSRSEPTPARSRTSVSRSMSSEGKRSRPVEPA